MSDLRTGSSAAWHGTRIILTQVSPESLDIFNLILELYASCSGNWDKLGKEINIHPGEMGSFLDYAATFLSNIGNYYVRLEQLTASIKISWSLTLPVRVLVTRNSFHQPVPALLRD